MAMAPALGQDNEILSEEDVQFPDAQGWEVGTHAGVLLPFGIVGVRDKYPWWGLYASHPGRVFSAFEYQLYHSRAKGVIFYQGSISGRVNFQAYDYLNGFFKLGVDLNYYQRKKTILRSFEYKSIIGAHVGFGNYVAINEKLNFRSEFKFNFNPGSSLYVGLGLSYVFDQGEGAENEGN